jgi:hypothetical protein
MFLNRRPASRSAPARRGYISATRHPWPCLLFLLPLLLAYEIGVMRLSGAQPELLRNGADTWLRSGLQATGFPQAYLAPGLIVAIFLAASWWQRSDRPPHSVFVCIGMALESGLLAFVLLRASQLLRPTLEAYDVHLALGPNDKTLRRVITFVGAGIYEEVMFRLLLFFLLGCILKVMLVPSVLAMPMKMVLSALAFAAAHHVGPYGEAFDSYLFVFRTLAGLYFALIYQFRGFGIAVGTHAGYDLLAGVLIPAV